jgi:hypothetical protein
MAYTFGDVVLVPFPFTDQSGGKKRPAVVVSSADYNSNRRDLVIMAITSKVRTPWILANPCLPIGKPPDYSSLLFSSRFWRPSNRDW